MTKKETDAAVYAYVGPCSTKSTSAWRGSPSSTSTSGRSVRWMLEWHCIINSDRTVLAVYGAALRDMAEAKQIEISKATGISVELVTVRQHKRPRVYDTV